MTKAKAFIPHLYILKEFQHKSKQLDSRLHQWKQAESEVY